MNTLASIHSYWAISRTNCAIRRFSSGQRSFIVIEREISIEIGNHLLDIYNIGKVLSSNK